MRSSVLDYIAKSWSALTRSMSECSTFSDRKTAGPQTLYLAQGFGVPGFIAHLESSCNVKVQLLPYMIPPMGQSTSPQQIPANIQPPGLLYLPNPYIVPGGRFNEMYGWDSYFIIRGLIRCRKTANSRAASSAISFSKLIITAECSTPIALTTSRARSRHFSPQ